MAWRPISRRCFGAIVDPCQRREATSARDTSKRYFGPRKHVPVCHGSKISDAGKRGLLTDALNLLPLSAANCEPPPREAKEKPRYGCVMTPAAQSR